MLYKSKWRIKVNLYWYYKPFNYFHLTISFQSSFIVTYTIDRFIEPLHSVLITFLYINRAKPKSISMISIILLVAGYMNINHIM